MFRSAARQRFPPCISGCWGANTLVLARDNSMSINRRNFLKIASSAVMASTILTAAAAAADAKPAIRAIAFDGFPIFDPLPIFAMAEELFPGRGAEFSNLWRIRQFEYTWLRTAAQRYRDFLGVIDDALVFAGKSLDLEMTNEKRKALVDGYMHMKAWPDVRPALSKLRDRGIRLAFLSNFSPAMLDANIYSASLTEFFEHKLSTDAVGVYKPHAKAYEMGIEAFGLKREEILFAAFAGWDAAGAKSFGYPTFWVNRQKQPLEQLDAIPDGEGSGMDDLLKFLSY
jgi:2-haloacid dehalogenase